MVTHSPSTLEAKEAAAITNNSWVDLDEEAKDQYKAPTKSGKRYLRKPHGNSKPRRGQVFKTSK